MSPCKNFVPGCQKNGDKSSPGRMASGASRPFIGRTKKRDPDICPSFVPVCPQGTNKEMPSGQSGSGPGTKCLDLSPKSHTQLYPYLYISPLIIEENGDKMGNLSPSRTVTGLRAPLVLSPVCFNLSPILNFVPRPLYDRTQGGDKFVHGILFCPLAALSLASRHL